jgi:hypothetical protein
MGMQRTVRFDPGLVPAWDAVRGQLARLGVSAAVKMIDNLPAFPDESPDPGWQELRVGTPNGMVTLRAAPGALTSVVWGNAGDALRSDWDALCWACAAAGAGRVETADGPQSADSFAHLTGLRPA